MDSTIQPTGQKDLTLKQRKWIKRYLECGNASQAAREVYDCDNDESAGQIGYENLKKLDYSDFLEEAGVTDKLLQEKIMEGLDATKVISARVIVKKDAPTSQENGELPVADSKTDDFIDIPDFIARHKYLETVLKLKKRLVDRQEITGKDGQPIQYKIITGTGFIPAGVIVDGTPEENTPSGQPSIQDGSVASEGS